VEGFEFSILGPLKVRRSGLVVPVPAPRQRAVLVTLLLHANQVVPVDRLVRLLWSDRPPASARNTLQSLVRRLRILLVPDELPGLRQPLVTQAPGYLLQVAPDRLDLHRFDDLWRHGRDALATGHPEQAAPLLDQAVRLWRGPPLTDVAADELQRTEGARLAEWYQQAVEERAEAYLRLGRGADLVGELRSQIAEHPFRERPYGQLMRALSATGQQAEALAAYRDLRQVLAEHLGIDPGPEVQGIHRALLRGEVSPAPTRPPVTAGPAARPWAVPHQLPRDVAAFTGRASELARLAAVRAAGDASLVTIVGSPGVGKTALALRWAYQLRDEFPDGQLFIDLRGFAATPPLRPIDALAQFLRALGVPADQVPVDPQEATALYRTVLADRRMLVVLDNARDSEQVRPLLPGNSDCLVVVTSRHRLDGLTVHEDAHRLTLAALSPAEANHLLALMVGSDQAAAEPEALAELARLCAYLPLALRLAAANLVARCPPGPPGQGNLRSYAARLAAGNRLAALEIATEGGSAVRTAFALSYATLPDAESRLFRLLGILPGTDLTVAAAAALAGVPREDAARQLDRLAAAHLAHEPAPGRYTCHDLLRHYAAELADRGPAEDRRAALHRLLAWYVDLADAAARTLYPERLRLPPAGRPGAPTTGWDDPAEAMRWLGSEQANLVAAVQLAAEQGPRQVAWQLADALRGYLSERANLVDWDAVTRAGLAAAEAEADLAVQAAMRLGLAEIDARRQRVSAIDRYQEVVKLSARAGWRAGQAAALGNLGNIHWDLGRSEAAVEHLTRALDLNRRLGRLVGQAANLGNLGQVCLELGQPEQAAEYLAESLDLFRRLGSRAGEVKGLINLGEVCLMLARLDQALAHLTEALTLAKVASNTLDEAEALRLLAEVHLAAGRPAQAGEPARAAVARARETRQPRIESLALTTLANTDLSAGRLADAIAGYSRALRVARAAGYPYPEGHAHLGLAEAHRRAGRPDRAAAHARPALTIAHSNGYRPLEDRAVGVLAAVTAGSRPGEPALLPRP
jgi:DNA-binding SARP family transcriptional activator/Tfp pilus assembly protein PilF